MSDPFREIRYKVFYGGRGSGKSWAVAQALIVMSDLACIRVLCCREIQNSIRDSSYQVLKDTAERLGIAGRFSFLESEIRQPLHLQGPVPQRAERQVDRRHRCVLGRGSADGFRGVVGSLDPDDSQARIRNLGDLQPAQCRRPDDAALHREPAARGLRAQSQLRREPVSTGLASQGA